MVSELKSKAAPAEERTRTRILVVDDHPLVCEGLADLIDGQSDMSCCGQAGTGLQARLAVLRDEPDLVLLDLRLGQEDGLDLIKQLRSARPELRILVLSQLDEFAYAERALRAGARGYVMKEQATNELLRAMRTVAEGQVYVSQRISDLALRRMADPTASGRPARLPSLSDREMYVFRAIGAGKSTREIAAELKLSVKTIETYREHLKFKLMLANAAELVHYAHQRMADLESAAVLDQSQLAASPHPLQPRVPPKGSSK